MGFSLWIPDALAGCAGPPAGLGSWWRAEGDARDNWGDNNGTNTGLAFAAGKVGRAFASSPVAGRAAASLRVTDGLTLEAWVNPSSVAGSTPRTIISKFDYPGTTRVGSQSAYLLGLTNNGRVCFTVSANSSARTNPTLVTTQVLPTKQWSFIVATYDGVNLRIYLNGSLAGAAAHAAGIFPGSPPLGIGGLPQTGLSVRLPYPYGQFYWPFMGLLDEVSLYNRALTDGEVAAIYTADVAG